MLSAPAGGKVLDSGAVLSAPAGGKFLDSGAVLSAPAGGKFPRTALRALLFFALFPPAGAESSMAGATLNGSGSGFCVILPD